MKEKKTTAGKTESEFEYRIISSISLLRDLGFAKAWTPRSFFRKNKKHRNEIGLHFWFTTWDRNIEVLVQCWTKKMLDEMDKDKQLQSEYMSSRKALNWVVSEKEVQKEVVLSLKRSGISVFTIENFEKIISGMQAEYIISEFGALKQRTSVMKDIHPAAYSMSVGLLRGVESIVLSGFRESLETVSVADFNNVEENAKLFHSGFKSFFNKRIIK